jgi:chloramphenicol-sensitive protein RarD
MSDATKGFLALIAANVIWGFSPIYYKELSAVPALELLSHRTLWSLVFFGAILALQGRLGAIPAAARGRHAALKLLVGAGLISINWGLFIWAIQVERAVETSLGYYIFPLISVILGMAVFREGAQPGKIVAFCLAMGAVGVLTYGLGAAPWVSLVLAISFAGYSVIKKTTATGPTVSVTAEVLIMTPFALGWLMVVHAGGAGQFGASWHDTVLLIFSGPLTAAPLILFSYASRRMGLATLGLVQYLNPTLQFLVAVLIFLEPVTRWHGIALPLIWVALAVYSVEALARERAARKAGNSASTS